MNDRVRLVFVGDISLNGNWTAEAGPPNWREPFMEIEPILREADMRIGNLESPLLLSSEPQRKRNLLGVPPDAAEALHFLNFTALSLANNHISDQGPEGLIKTRALLTSLGISPFGAGKDLAEASRPAFARANGLSFAFLGYAEESRDVGATLATQETAGCAPLSLERIRCDIKALSGMDAYVVVSLHWGYQFDPYPEPRQVEMARKIIDLGALIVHGHHPHVLQGMERYRNGLILYSLGNFYFPDFKRADGCWFRFPKESRSTAAVQCEVGTEGVRSVFLVPLEVGSDFRVRVLGGSKTDRSQAEFASRSTALHSPDYCERWSRQRRKTAAWRANAECKLRLYDELTSRWSRMRSRGMLVSLKGLRPRHILQSFRQLRRFFLGNPTKK